MDRIIKGNFVLGAGYAVVLALLICSTVEAYRLQRTLSKTEAAVYQRHIVRENALSALRDLMWLGATEAREYILTGDSSRFREQIADIVREGNARGAAIRPEAFRSFSGYTAALTTLAESEPVDRQLALGRIDEELLPQRIGVLGMLRKETVAMQNQLRSAERDLARTQRAILWQLIAMLGGCLLAGIVIAWGTLRYARNRHQERTEQAARMAHLSARLQEVQEEERKSLARELHDEVGQTFTALRMEIAPALAAIEHPAARARLRNAQKLAEHGLRTVRHISLMLRPSLLDDLGLDAALDWHLKEFSGRSGIQSEYLPDETMPELSDETRTCVYRVAQEALNNCEKYSGASKARLVMRIAGESLMLEISDNGNGFDLDPRGVPRSGTGLLGIRERVARLGGSTLIDTAPGLGTRVVAVLPLAPAGKKPEKILA